MEGQGHDGTSKPDDLNPAARGLSALREASDWDGVSRLMEFVHAVFEARSLAVAGQLTALAILQATGARSCRVLFIPLSKPVGTLDTVAIANRPGVSSLSGTGLVFEGVDQIGAVARAIGERAVVVEGEMTHLPLLARDRVVAIAQLLGVSAPNVEPALAFAAPAALALEAAGLNVERVQREREARTVAELFRLIGGTLDLASILERTVSFACRAVNLERGILALFDDLHEGTAISRNAYFHGFGRDAGPVVTLSRDSFERLVVRSQPVVLNDVRASRRAMAAGPRQLGAESFLIVPLAAHGRALGVLYLDTTRAGVEIGDRVLRLAGAIAGQASLAVANARQYAEESRKRISAEGLREVVLATGGSLNLSVAVERILQHARDLIGAGACAIFELGSDGVLGIRTALGLETRFLGELRFPSNSGAIGLAVSTGRPVVIEDLHDDETSRPGNVQALLDSREFPFRGMLGLPLSARGRVFGGLALYFEDAHKMTEEDIHVMEVFAGHAAVTLENARLYEDEVRREREAEVLLRVARFTGETLDLNQVLTRVALEVTDALELGRCFVGFVDTVANDRAELGRLYAHGFETDLEELRPFVIADEAFERLMIDREPIVFNGLRGEDSLGAEGPSLLGAEACVIAPLVAQGEVIGVLYSDTVEPGAVISERAAFLAAAIADQAALAIQNARLFESIGSQEARYRQLAESAHDIILTTDIAGSVTFANPAIGQVLGLKPESLIGRPVLTLLAKESVKVARAAWERALTHLAATFEGHALRADGGRAYLEVNVSALKRDGEVIGSLAIARDLTGQKQLAEEITQRGEDLERTSARALELRSFLSLFTQAQEEERRRIARELHDDTAQTLVAIGRRLDRLEGSLAARESGEVSVVHEIRQDLDTAIASVRRFARNLRPSVLDDLGLLPALEWLASQASTPTRLEVSGPSGGAPGRPSPDLELTIFRVVQEALTNVDKHARATSAAVRVRFDPNGQETGRASPGLLISVQDDGDGFREAPRDGGGLTSRVLAGLAASGHLGLAGMRERVNLAGGEMRVRSAPGEGCELSFWFRWR